MLDNVDAHEQYQLRAIVRGLEVAFSRDYGLTCKDPHTVAEILGLRRDALWAVEAFILLRDLCKC